MRRRLETLLEDEPDGSKLAQLVKRDRDVRPAWRRFRAARARLQASEFLDQLG